MAKLYDNFTSDTLMSFGKSFSRLNGQPLDKTEIWYDFDSAKSYAESDAAYVGQKISVVDTASRTVTHYSIENEAGDLKEIGSDIDLTPYDSHLDSKENPHGVTKSQVGLGNVTNDSQVKRSEMGSAGGVATLDSNGYVLASQLNITKGQVIDALGYEPGTGNGDSVDVDETLTVEGAAADAKTVGDQISQINQKLDNLDYQSGVSSSDDGNGNVTLEALYIPLSSSDDGQGNVEIMM